MSGNTVQDLSNQSGGYDYANSGFTWANEGHSIASGAAEGVTVGATAAVVAMAADAAITTLAAGSGILAAGTAAYAAGAAVVVGIGAGAGIGATAGVMGAAVGAVIGALVGLGIQNNPNLPWDSWPISTGVSTWLTACATPLATDPTTIGWPSRLNDHGEPQDDSQWIVPSTMVAMFMTPSAFTALSSWLLNGNYGADDATQANSNSPLFFDYAYDFYNNSNNPLRQAMRTLFTLHPETFAWATSQFDAAGNQTPNDSVQVPHDVMVLASLFGAIAYSAQQSSYGQNDGRPDMGLQWFHATDIGTTLAFQRCFPPPWYQWDDSALAQPPDRGEPNSPGPEWYFTGSDETDMNNANHRNAALHALAQDALWASKNPHTGILKITGRVVAGVLSQVNGSHINTGVLIHNAALIARVATFGTAPTTMWGKIKAWIEHLAYWLEAKIVHRGPLYGVAGRVGALALGEGTFLEEPHEQLPAGYSQNNQAHTVAMWMADPIRSTFAFDYGGLHADENDISDALDNPQSNPALSHILDGLSSGGLATDPDAQLPTLALRLTQMKRAAESLVGRALAGDQQARGQIIARVKTEDVGGIMLRDLLELAKVQPIQVKALNRPVHYNRAAYPLA